MTVKLLPEKLPAWVLLNVAAMSSGLAHACIDHHLGLYGAASFSMSPLQVANIALTCLAAAWWMLCLVPTTEIARPALSGAFALAVVWSFLANGVAALVAAPTADAFPTRTWRIC